MKKTVFACAMLFFSTVFTSASIADEKSAQPWQKQSLQGIGSLRYAVAEGSNGVAVADLGSSLSKLKVPTTAVKNLNEDYAKPLSTNEARLKAYVKDREKDQSWVGLSIEQQCQLKRTPSITVDAETYSIGKLCPRKQVNATVKELCTQFVSDFSAKPGK